MFRIVIKICDASLHNFSLVHFSVRNFYVASICSCIHICNIYNISDDGDSDDEDEESTRPALEYKSIFMQIGREFFDEYDIFWNYKI